MLGGLPSTTPTSVSRSGRRCSVALMSGGPSVVCSQCGLPIDEPTNLDPAKRKPCPRCGSTARTINVQAVDRLSVIEGAYARRVQESNARLDDIIRRAQAPAGAAGGTGEAYDARVETAETPAALTGEVIREQSISTSAAIFTLIDVTRAGQTEAAKSAAELVDWTKVIGRWTRVIGWATLLALAVAVAALVVAILVWHPWAGVR
jgi:hypothetical protein